MILFDRINEDFKAAFKAKEEAKVSTLRMLKAALKNKQIDLMRELTEDEAMAVIKSQLKQLKDSADSFASGGRPELAASAGAEMRVLKVYLPAQMDDAALASVVKEALSTAGLTTKADQGKAMGIAMKVVAGKADGARVREVVAALLAVLAVIAYLLPASSVCASGVNAASSPIIFTDASIRIVRIFLLLMGVLAVNVVLVGAFTVITAGGRDDAHEHGLHKMAFGVFATIVVMALFSVATNALQKGL